MIPNLLNKITVEIKKVKKSGTQFHNGKKEPSTYVAFQTKFKIQAQIFFKKTKIIAEATGGKITTRELGGIIEEADGYIIVRKVDLQLLSKTLELGDRLVSYGDNGKEIECLFYMVGFKEGSHYSDQGNFTLEQWFFQDRG